MVQLPKQKRIFKEDIVMKKVISLLLALAMIGLCLAGCAQKVDENPASSDAAPSAPVEPSAEPSEEPSEEPSPEPSEEPPAEEPNIIASYRYTYTGVMGTEETIQIDLQDDGTALFSLPEHAVLTDVYIGDYTQDGDTVSITGLANVDPTSDFTSPGMWNFIDLDGNMSMTIDEATQTFEPVK